MIGWQNSRSTDRKHEHTTITDDKGQEVCSSCHQIVIKPIIDSDDPRLAKAGFMRSGHHEKQPLHDPMPLPEILIAMYDQSQGDFPVAPYIIITMTEHGKRNTLSDNMWIELARKTQF